ncbi:hypothetical protein KKH07_03075 [Patescibacteria group bacterium]|nr:hypothetical protein [Patescibacteria group bacterium]MBU1563939.1 hypothetical protein [Patescibacteria group bacterium]
MIKIKKNNYEKGAALLLSLTIILTVSVFIGASLTFLTLDSINSAQAKIESTKSYYLAEAGIEDTLLRLKNNMQISSPNTLTIGDDSTTIEITSPIGGSRTITSQGNADNKIKKIAVAYYITSDEVNFHYGAQAGEGGIIMGNNSGVQGNVFSNGSISGLGTITNTATIAGIGNTIEDMNVDGDVYTYSCSNANIDGTLYYVSGGIINNCSYGSIEILSDPIETEDLPISEEEMNDWKAEATAGGTILGDYIISDDNESLGPIKITGNLTININAILTITGTIYVQGDINTNNNSIIQLSDDYESLSGIIISDGKIAISNNVATRGSGQEGSYLMMLSTNNSLDLNDPAIDLNNNAEGAIFYASNGVIYLHNNINVREATGYKLALDNNAIINYDIGLENINFSTGPGGGWSVENWREIE